MQGDNENKNYNTLNNELAKAGPKENEKDDQLFQYIVQIERPGSKLDMTTVKEILKDTGIKLDEKYGPFSVNPKLGRYVVRGVVNSLGAKRLENIPGVKIFKDTKVSPVT